MTDEELKQLEARAAGIVARLEGLCGEGDDSLIGLKDKVKAVCASVEEFKKLNIANVCALVEQMKAQQDVLVRAIRGSKHGFYVPGIENEKFSLLRALIGAKTGNWKGAGKEKEILEAARAKASHVIGDDQSAGFFVPDQVIPEVIAAVYTKSVFVNLQGEGTTRVSVLDGLVGGNVTIPKFDGGLVAYWIGEEDEYAESKTNVGNVTLNPRKLGVLIRLTEDMRKMQGYGFENLVRTDMVRALAKKLDWTIAFGNGSDNMPLGIVNQPGIKVFDASDGTIRTPEEAAAVADWALGELGFDGMMNMDLALEEDDIVLDETAVRISSPRFWNRRKQDKIQMFSGQTDKMAYLMGAPFLTDGELRSIVGEFDKTPQIGSADKPGASMGLASTGAAKATTVIGGNLGDVVLGRWGGLEIDDDGGKGKGFTSDHTYIKARLRADVATRQPRGLIVCPNAQARD